MDRHPIYFDVEMDSFFVIERKRQITYARDFNLTMKIEYIIPYNYNLLTISASILHLN